MKYTIVPANTPEQDRFVSISDFKECMHWGGEVEFIWKGTRYGAVRYGQGNKISVYVANRQETERLYDITNVKIMSTIHAHEFAERKPGFSFLFLFSVKPL